MLNTELGRQHRSICTNDFGRELLIVEGYDKLTLEKGRDAIDAELEWHTYSNEGKVASSLCRTT